MSAPGFAAKFWTICPRCSRDIQKGDRVVRHRGSVIHVECSSGFSDED